MSENTSLSIGFIILVGTFLIALFKFFKEYKKSIVEDAEKREHEKREEEMRREQEKREEAEKREQSYNDIKTAFVQSLNSVNESVLKLNFKTDQICNTTNETRTDLKSMKNDIEEVKSKQIRNEMQIEALWRKVDELNGLLND